MIKADFTKMFKRIVKVEDIATTKILVLETLLICKSMINHLNCHNFIFRVDFNINDMEFYCMLKPTTTQVSRSLP